MWLRCEEKALKPALTCFFFLYFKQISSCGFGFSHFPFSCLMFWFISCSLLPVPLWLSDMVLPNPDYPGAFSFCLPPVFVCFLAFFRYPSSSRSYPSLTLATSPCSVYLPCLSLEILLSNWCLLQCRSPPFCILYRTASISVSLLMCVFVKLDELWRFPSSPKLHTWRTLMPFT